MKIPSFIMEMPTSALVSAPSVPVSSMFRRSFSAFQSPSPPLASPPRSSQDDSIHPNLHTVSTPDLHELVLFPSYACCVPNSQEKDLSQLHVHVHGWIYASPSTAGFNRKHKLLLSLARQIAGLPSPVSSDDSIFSPSPPLSYRRNSTVFRRQQSLPRYERYFPNTSLDVLNSNLAERILPVISQPVTCRQVLIQLIGRPSGRILKEETIETDDRGHFKCKLLLTNPATEDITIIASSSSSHEKTLVQESSCSVVVDKGISFITDVDDTVKKSNVPAGKRELFRNVFLRDHAELQIPGVKEWFNSLASKGIHFHYVSNAPWQVWPTIREFFKAVELPQGSVHLKLYTGVLSGLWQPAMVKKRANLESIFNDFPYRKFILNGDSGERDLEIYTDMAIKFPNQVLAIMIRDVSISEGFQKLRPEPSDSSLSTFDESATFSTDLSSRNIPLTPSEQPSERCFSTPADSGIYKSSSSPRKHENFQRRLSRSRQLLKHLNINIYVWKTGIDAQLVCHEILDAK